MKRGVQGYKNYETNALNCKKCYGLMYYCHNFAKRNNALEIAKNDLRKKKLDLKLHEKVRIMVIIRYTNLSENAV